MQRIFKYGDSWNISLTPDKELNILVYRSPSYVIIYRSNALLKMVHFFGPPCILVAAACNRGCYGHNQLTTVQRCGMYTNTYAYKFTSQRRKTPDWLTSFDHCLNRLRSKLVLVNRVVKFLLMELEASSVMSKWVISDVWLKSFWLVNEQQKFAVTWRSLMNTFIDQNSKMTERQHLSYTTLIDWLKALVAPYSLTNRVH